MKLLKSNVVTENNNTQKVYSQQGQFRFHIVSGGLWLTVSIRVQAQQRTPYTLVLLSSPVEEIGPVMRNLKTQNYSHHTLDNHHKHPLLLIQRDRTTITPS
eukprot:6461721-Amphidinium_carterae.1